MTEAEAREILGEWIVSHSGALYHAPKPFVAQIDANIRLDGKFTPSQLEAIAWWMRNKGGKGE